MESRVRTVACLSPLHGTGPAELVRAAALIDLRQLDEAENVLQTADTQALHGIPAQAALSILRARIQLANGRLADAAAEAQAALATAETFEAHGDASTAHCVLAVIALPSRA